MVQLDMCFQERGVLVVRHRAPAPAAGGMGHLGGWQVMKILLAYEAGISCV
jgi:hypothetical protein